MKVELLTFKARIANTIRWLPMKVDVLLVDVDGTGDKTVQMCDHRDINGGRHEDERFT